MKYLTSVIQAKKLLLFVIALVSFGLASAVLKLSPNFGGYDTVLRRTSSGGDKVQIFQSIWGAIRADFPEDTQKTKDLYAQITNFISNEQKCTESSGRAACELQQEVRRHLRKLTAQRLANLLNAEQSIEAYSMYLTSSIEPSLVRDIFEIVIGDIYYHKSVEQLIRQLYQIYTENDEASFRIMIEAQLALYWKFRNVHDINDEYLLDAAYHFNKIMTNHLYGNVDATLDRRLRDAYNSLPDSLHYFFSQQGFCLRNKEHDEYLYTTITDEMNFGGDGRYVFTWHEKNYTDYSAVMRSFASEERPSAGSMASFSKRRPMFTLRGELYKWYFYLESSKANLLAAWRSGSPTATSTWTIKYIDGYLVFRQGDLTLCTGEPRDEERRNVNAFSGRLQLPPIDGCLWAATQCTIK